MSETAAKLPRKSYKLPLKKWSMMKIYTVFLQSLKVLLSVCIFLSSAQLLWSQNIIGAQTGNPTAILDLQSTDKGLLIPRLTSDERSAITNPAPGLMIFNTTLNCLEINLGSSGSPDWVCMLGGSKVSSLDCGGAVITGSLMGEVAASGVTASVSYTGGDGGFHSGQTVASTGVTGLTATLIPGTFAVGSGSLTYTVTGTPSGGGTASFVLGIGGQNCALSLTVSPPIGTITGLNCAGASITGTLTANVPASGLSASVPYTGSNGGTYSGQTVTSTGVTGLTATLSGGTLTSGTGSLIYTITGTPSAAGTASFALSLGSQSCTLTVTVAANPGSLPPGSGSFAGRTCFDIALSNDNTNSCAPLSNRLARQADFTNAATHTQVYTFRPTGTVSNVRFIYLNTNGNVVTGLSGGNSGNNISTPVTVTVNYNTNLNTLALGLTNSNPLTAEIFVIYNDGATNNGTDQQLKLNILVKDCVCCGAFVTSTQWKDFMCHNLGADQSANAFVPSWELNGHYYQWGRNPTCFGRDGVDGTNPCSSPVYGAAGPWGNTTANDNAGSITGWSTTAAPNDAWADNSKTVNDPCPPGFRVPTIDQLQGVITRTAENPRTQVGSWMSSSTNYSSGALFGLSLFLPSSGQRLGTTGALAGRGDGTIYWSSSISNDRSLGINTASVLNLVTRTTGLPIRCIAE